MRCFSSNSTPARGCCDGLNAAQARNWPSCDSTRTGFAAVAAALAMALQNPGATLQ